MRYFHCQTVVSAITVYHSSKNAEHPVAFSAWMQASWPLMELGLFSSWRTIISIPISHLFLVTHGLPCKLLQLVR